MSGPVLTSTNPRGDRLGAAAEVVGLRSMKALADYLDERNFSLSKLNRIRNGTGTLSPADGDYIAKRLGLPSSFFTAEIRYLGDVRAGESAAFVSSPVDGLARDATAGHDELDRLLDHQAETGSVDPPPADGEAPPQTGTRP